MLESAEARDDACAHAGELLDALVCATRERANGFTVKGVLVEDAASAALLDQGESVDLLVVGSRGRGGLRSMLFGSVAHAMTEHATCPTVVLRSPQHHEAWLPRPVPSGVGALEDHDGDLP